MHAGRPHGSRPQNDRVLAGVLRLGLGLLAVGALWPGPATALAATDSAWRQYEDPSKTVTIDVPTSWQAGKPTGVGSSRTSVTFRLPGGAELALSVASDVPPGERTLVKSLKGYFPEEAALAVPRQTRAKNWLGIRQDATGQVAGTSRAWLGQFYVFESTLVGLTLSADSARIDSWREDFERVIKSVRYHSPPIDAA